MTVDRPEEQLAFETIERVLGVRVEQYDIGSRQRAVDGLLHYPNGQIAALEVSSVGPLEEARISNMLDRPDQCRRQISGLRRNWMVTVRRSFHPADLRQVDRALLRCEELGLVDLQSNRQDEQARTLHGAGVRAHATDDARQPPVAWVLLEMIGGFTVRKP